MQTDSLTMTETVQLGNVRERRPSKASWGRLRLTTSCTECHRRKQKCDREQPCRNCARRYPQPSCLYLQTPATGVTPSTSHYHRSSSIGEGEAASASQSQIVRSNDSFPWPPEWPSGIEDLERTGGVSRRPLDEVDVGVSYQVSLSAMIKKNAEVLDYMTAPQEKSCYSRHGRLGYQCYHDDCDHDEAPLPAMMGRKDLALRCRSTSPLHTEPSVDPLHYLPTTPNPLNGKLFHALVNVITKFVVSIDGNPSPNYYNDQWIPWSIKSPLLVQIGLFTAANYQAEARKVPAAQSRVAIAHKCQAISMLNEMVRSPSLKESTSDEAVAAVVYFTTHEWYWGTAASVRAHLRGLQDMVRLRGDLHTDMNTFLRQMIFLCDYHIAISYEDEPRFQHHAAAFNLLDKKLPYSPHLDSPLLVSPASFAKHSAVLPLNAESWLILDDIRFLTTSILEQTDTSPTSVERIHVLAHWTLSRLSALPTTTRPETPPLIDNIYKSCLAIALIYVRAISKDEPLSKACTPADLNHLWTTMWQVTLTQWKQNAGIFIWMLLVINPAARETRYGRLVKSLLKSASFYVGLQAWDVIDKILGGFMVVQRWLRDRAGDLGTS